MKKLILSLVIIVLLFGGSANATHLPRLHAYQKLLAEIYLEDIKWRKPELIFTFEESYILIVTEKTTGKLYGSYRGNDKYSVVFDAYNVLIKNIYSLPNDPYYLTPVVPKIIKNTMDFSLLPIGFKTLNPDDGLIEERWDGSTWLRPNQLSTLDFSPGAGGITK